MLTNDQLDAWDRAHFLHPSTHLGQFARGEAPNRIITGGSGCHIEDRDGRRLLDAFAPHAELLKRTKRGSRYKTGTLDDVSTLAGYAQTSNHGLVRFVIALPGRTGRLRFSILSAIEQGL